MEQLLDDPANHSNQQENSQKITTVHKAYYSHQ